jgi:hypothetical protein
VWLGRFDDHIPNIRTKLAAHFPLRWLGKFAVLQWLLAEGTASAHGRLAFVSRARGRVGVDRCSETCYSEPVVQWYSDTVVQWTSGPVDQVVPTGMRCQSCHSHDVTKGSPHVVAWELAGCALHVQQHRLPGRPWVLLQVAAGT